MAVGVSSAVRTVVGGAGAALVVVGIGRRAVGGGGVLPLGLVMMVVGELGVVVSENRRGVKDAVDWCGAWGNAHHRVKKNVCWVRAFFFFGGFSELGVCYLKMR